MRKITTSGSVNPQKFRESNRQALNPNALPLIGAVATLAPGRKSGHKPGKWKNWFPKRINQTTTCVLLALATIALEKRELIAKRLLGKAKLKMFHVQASFQRILDCLETNFNLRISRRTLIYHLKKLEREGYLRVHRQKSNRWARSQNGKRFLVNLPNRYQLTIKAVELIKDTLQGLVKLLSSVLCMTPEWLSERFLYLARVGAGLLGIREYRENPPSTATVMSAAWVLLEDPYFEPRKLGNPRDYSIWLSNALAEVGKRARIDEKIYGIPRYLPFKGLKGFLRRLNKNIGDFFGPDTSVWCGQIVVHLTSKVFEHFKRRSAYKSMGWKEWMRRKGRLFEEEDDLLGPPPWLAALSTSTV